MTKPVAVFRLGVIGDSIHTARLEGKQSMLPAEIGCMASCQLITILVGSRGRVGLVTPTPSGHLPALFGGPFHVQLGEGF
jgi:hypothetical protein